MRAIVEDNPRKTVREIAKELEIDIATISRHLEAIGQVKKLDKWVPHELNNNQKILRLEICSSLLTRNQNDPFLDLIITCDEKWILYDNRRRSAQWLDRDEAPKHMPKPNLHPKKIMVTVWWSSIGIIHYNFMKSGETITTEKYCREIDIVHQKLLELWPSLVNQKGFILLHDNARPHISRITQQKLNELGYEVLPHPPYSPDISSIDYHFFKHLDLFLRKKLFSDERIIETAFQQFIESRNRQFFRNGTHSLVGR